MSSLPILHVFALIAGIIAIFFIRKKYRGITTTELVLIIVLYTALVLLFTDPVVNGIMTLLSEWN
jgi:hypothetical protein